MATIQAIALREGRARQKLTTAMQRLSETLHVPATSLAVTGRDRAWVEMRQVEILADWAEQLADTADDLKGNLEQKVVLLEAQLTDFNPAVQAEQERMSDRLGVLRILLQRELEGRTKADLVTFAEQYGLTVSETAKKAEMLTSLLEQLTGKQVEVISQDRVPDDAELLLSGPGFAQPLDDGQVLHVKDKEG